MSINEENLKKISEFHLPRYREIPNVGLYLDQTSKFVNEYLEELPIDNLTTSMISNYVKKKLIPNPIKKQYYRDQIAYLIFIALTKNAISLENAGQIIQLQQKSFALDKSYNYLVDEFEKQLKIVFSLEDNKLKSNDNEEHKLIKNILITVSYQIYLQKSFEDLKL